MSYGQYVMKKEEKTMNKENNSKAPKPGIVRLLITQALEQLQSEYDGLDCREVGNAVGLLTAAKMILEGDP